MSAIDDILAWLGADPGVELRRIDEDPAPASGVGHGRAAAAASLDELAARIDGAGSLVIEARPRPPCDRLAEAPGVVRVDLGPGVDVRGPTALLADDLVLLDTRGAAGLIRWRTEDGEWIARLLDGDCEVYEVAREAPASVRAFRDPAVPPLPAFEVPAVEALLGDEAVEPWLAPAARARLASPSAIDRVAGAGLVRRLWAPPAGAAADVFARLLDGDASPATRVDAWARALPGEVAAELEAMATRAAGALEDALEQLGAVHAEAPARLGEVVRALAHRRDDLESVRAVLRAAGHDAVLASALAAVDLAAELATTALAAAPRHPGDDLLAAVSWAAPDAWWGQLAVE